MDLAHVLIIYGFILVVLLEASFGIVTLKKQIVTPLQTKHGRFRFSSRYMATTKYYVTKPQIFRDTRRYKIRYTTALPNSNTVPTTTVSQTETTVNVTETTKTTVPVVKVPKVKHQIPIKKEHVLSRNEFLPVINGIMPTDQLPVNIDVVQVSNIVPTKRYVTPRSMKPEKMPVEVDVYKVKNHKTSTKKSNLGKNLHLRQLGKKTLKRDEHQQRKKEEFKKREMKKKMERERQKIVDSYEDFSDLDEFKMTKATKGVKRKIARLGKGKPTVKRQTLLNKINYNKHITTKQDIIIDSYEDFSDLAITKKPVQVKKHQNIARTKKVNGLEISADDTDDDYLENYISMKPKVAPVKSLFGKKENAALKHERLGKVKRHNVKKNIEHFIAKKERIEERKKVTISSYEDFSDRRKRKLAEMENQKGTKKGRLSSTLEKKGARNEKYIDSYEDFSAKKKRRQRRKKEKYVDSYEDAPRKHDQSRLKKYDDDDSDDDYSEKRKLRIKRNRQRKERLREKAEKKERSTGQEQQTEKNDRSPGHYVQEVLIPELKEYYPPTKPVLHDIKNFNPSPQGVLNRMGHQVHFPNQRDHHLVRFGRERQEHVEKRPVGFDRENNVPIRQIELPENHYFPAKPVDMPKNWPDPVAPGKIEQLPVSQVYVVDRRESHYPPTRPIQVPERKENVILKTKDDIVVEESPEPVTKKKAPVTKKKPVPKKKPATKQNAKSKPKVKRKTTTTTQNPLMNKDELIKKVLLHAKKHMQKTKEIESADLMKLLGDSKLVDHIADMVTEKIFHTLIKKKNLHSSNEKEFEIQPSVERIQIFLDDNDNIARKIQENHVLVNNKRF